MVTFKNNEGTIIEIEHEGELYKIGEDTNLGTIKNFFTKENFVYLNTKEGNTFKARLLASYRLSKRKN